MSINEKEIVNKILEGLYNNNIVNSEQLKKLIEHYENINMPYNDILKELEELKKEPNKITNILKDEIVVSGVNVASVKEEKGNTKEDIKLSLENIADFEKDGKSYIKIHYPLPEDTVRIIENRTDPYSSGKEIFEELKEVHGLLGSDGIDNTVTLFEDILEKKCHETLLYNQEDLTKYSEFKKLSTEEQKNVLGLARIMADNKEKFEDKVILLSPEENIIVIQTPNYPEQDELRKIEFNEQKQKYELVPLDEKGYNMETSEDKTADDSLSTNDENEEYEKNSTDNLDDIISEKERGTSKKPVPPWKRRKKDAAFISIAWISIFMGILATIMSIITLNLH